MVAAHYVGVAMIIVGFPGEEIDFAEELLLVML